MIPVPSHASRIAAVLLSVAAFLGVAASAAAAPADIREELREDIDALRAGRAQSMDGEMILSRNVLPGLYEAAAFAPQWSDPERVAALIAALEGLAGDGLEPADYHVPALKRLAAGLRSATPADAAHFDLLASDGLVLAIYHLWSGKVDPKTINPEWNFDARPATDALITAAVRRAIASGQIGAELDAARPHHWMYDRGRELLRAYREIAARGGWERIGSGPVLKPGMTDARMPALRRRLEVEGDLEAGHAGNDDRYDEALAAGVKAFQARHLLEPDGTIGAGTLKELNTPAEDRVTQIRANLERARWVLHEIGDEDQVVVDIAGYEVRYLHERKPVWSSRVIVGQPFRQTPSFRAQIEYVVFNPTWTVPPGILAKDILPQMKKGSDVLARKHLKVVDRQGREVDPKSVNWAHYTAANFPYFLRQDAGDANALGRVKIMFPNPYLVYLHDTPTRSLFDKDRRNFSSGCIRVEKPLELAERVLADPTTWNRAAIDAAVDSGATRTVNLKQKVPVLLIYWTVDQDAAGRAVFKPDVYGLDPPLIKALTGRVSVGRRRAA